MKYFAIAAVLGSIEAQDVEQKLVAKINAYRKIAGLESVTLDAELSKGCAAHAKYLVTNDKHPSIQGMGSHSEDPKLPGYSDAGLKAAKSSDIGLGMDPINSVDGWMATFFHRLPLLDPDLKSVGFGYAQGGSWRWVTVADILSGRGSGKPAPPVLVYPIDKQTGVATAYARELPDSTPESKDKVAGYPVTVTFAPGLKVKNVTAVLKDASGRPVQVWVSTPEKPVAGSGFQHNSISIIATAPLQSMALYTVVVTADVDEKKWTKTWSFTTGR